MVHEILFHAGDTVAAVQRGEGGRAPAAQHLGSQRGGGEEGGGGGGPLGGSLHRGRSRHSRGHHRLGHGLHEDLPFHQSGRELDQSAG